MPLLTGHGQQELDRITRTAAKVNWNELAHRFCICPAIHTYMCHNIYFLLFIWSSYADSERCMIVASGRVDTVEMLM